MNEISYISSSCNTTICAAHWGKNNLICFASSNAVFIYNPKIGGGKITHTLYKHTNRVNTVKWISGNEDETELVSGSIDKKAIVWTYRDNEYVPEVLIGHKSIINVIDALYVDNIAKSLVVATASVDSEIRIWSRLSYDGNFSQTQILNLGYELCVSLKFTFLTCQTLILAYGLSNSNIHIYTDENLENKNFTKATVITGHSDWVRCLDFAREGADILLASCSQDATIHIHRITNDKSVKERYLLKTTRNEHKIIRESVIAGHEGWAYSINWNPNCLKLLSASMDKTLIIWEYNDAANMWLETARLGEVGGNTLGFYGAMFGPDGESILAYSYHGAFHIWNCDDYGIWTPSVTVSGHFDEVVDIAWDADGRFLVSVSTDKTTRIHAPWKNDTGEITWHEIARPQVHGYDMSAIAMLPQYKFVSSAEEKVIRVFQAPENFVENFQRICNVTNDNIDIGALPKGASVPSLGLSNKAVYENNNESQARPKSDKDMYAEESYFTAVELFAPPTEETLIQNTLWPEIQKLYGHGNEVYTLATTRDGTLLASACKSTTAEHAAILLWETTSWKQIQKLVSHTLTIAQLAFSPDCKHLLSVSRDRRWSLFTKNEDTNQFELVATTDKKTGIHTRIIWTCAWSHDSLYFATGSRDAKVVVWTKNPNKEPTHLLGQYEAASTSLITPSSVTALCFSPILVKDKYLLAVGLECGSIHLYLWCKEWLRVLTYDHSIAHHLTVKRMSFRPVSGKAGHDSSHSDVLQLASCSSDHSVRVYDVNINNLCIQLSD